MPRKIDRQREIDQRGAAPGTAGDLVLSTTPTVGPAIPVQGGPTALAVATNVLMFSAVTPLALIGLTWEPAVGIQAARHQIEAATNSGFTTGVIRREAPSGQLSASLELPTGVLYYFRVKAITEFVESDWSNTASATTATDTTAPAVPTSPVATFNNAGDLEVTWVNPTSANLRDVEVSIYADSGFTTLLYRAYSATQALIWTASQNRQAGSGTPDPAVYVRLASRNWTGTLSAYVSPTQPVKAVPANVASLTQSWLSDAGTAPADLVVTWAAASGASFYRLSIDSVSRDVFGTRFVYNFDQNRSEHSGTPDPVLSLSIIGVDGLDQVSATPTTTTATNAAPAAPSGVTNTAFFSVLAVNTTSVLPADGITYRYRLIQTVPSAADITWDSPSPLQTRAISLAATYQIGVKMVDVFGQAGSETLATAVVADALTLADLRAESIYSDSGSTAAATLKAALADNDLTGTGGSTPTFVAATSIALANSATTVQQTPPVGVTLNDTMIAHVVARGDGQTISTPSGWTLIASTPTTDTSTTPDNIHAVFWRNAGATETSPYTFTVGSSNTIGAVIAVFRGCDNSNPIDVDADQTNASSTTITAPTITTTVNNALLVFMVGGATTQAITPGGSLAEQWEQSGGTNTVLSYGATESFATAGATGTRTSTFASARASIGLLFALKPSAAGGGGISYASNASWVRWIRFERPLSDRYKTITLSMSPASGTTNWYIRTSIDGSAWSYFAGTVTSGHIIATAGSAGAAQTAAISSATLGSSSNSRVDLPSIVEARYIELWLRNTAASTTVAEFYPRRIVQSDDIEAESIRAINILAGSITADRLSVSQLSAITADMGTITAGTITGATIQTATGTGARIELTSANGLRSYNSSNVLQTQIRTTDGALISGDGKTALSSGGLNLTEGVTFADRFDSKVQFTPASGIDYTFLYAYRDTGVQTAVLVAGAPTAGSAMVAIGALDEFGGDIATLSLATEITLTGAWAVTSYTPTYQGSTTGGSTTYTTQQGWYIRIGNIVLATGTLVWTAASGTGNVRILLPVTSKNTSGQRYIGAVYTESVTFANGSIQAVNFANNNTLRLFSPITNGAATELSIEAAGTIIFSILYQV